LNDDRSPDIKQPAPALHVAIPTSEQISIEENTSERLQDTPVEYCTSAPLTAQGVPATMMSLRETEVEEVITFLDDFSQVSNFTSILIIW